MTRALVFVSLLLLVPPEDASAKCGLQFEVAASSGMPVPASRATRKADAGACEFDVRLQPTDAACTRGPLVVRGLASSAGDTGWDRQRIRSKAHGVRRRVLRARMADSHGAAGKARLILRCAADPSLAGCERILAESAYCYLGGGERVRVAGLDSGQVCRRSDADDVKVTRRTLRRTLRAQGRVGRGLMSRDLAVFAGSAYTCAGSANGGFVATPLDGGESSVVAGPCEATTTDGESLLVLPASGFDLVPSGKSGTRLGARAETTGSLTEIRAYAFPEAVPTGAYEIAFDLADIPVDSPCAGIRPSVLAAADGAIYASDPTIDGICVLGSAGGAFAGSAGGAFVRRLDLEDFDGQIEGMSALDGGRLVVLARSTTVLPPVGYDDGSGSPVPGGCPECGQTFSQDVLHVFDVLTGARLDSVSIDTSLALGISCETGSP